MSGTSSASEFAVARPAGVHTLPALEAPLSRSCFLTQTLLYARVEGVQTVCAGRSCQGRGQPNQVNLGRRYLA